jgi:uncharacterized membrane protein
VNGVAVNCPPEMFAGQTFGPLIFEGVEKCQKSPIWMLLILWGFFVYCGLWLWNKGQDESTKKILLIWSGYCLALIIFPEFFYFKDIYPAHFRSNTMFKLGYQAFIMMSIVSGYTIVKGVVNIKLNKIWMVGVIPLLGLVLIYPTLSVKSYFGKLGLSNYKELYGLSWMKQRYPDDLLAVEWLNKNIKGQAIILEANGDSYTDYERISTFTGLPTVAGWTVHEWLWRGGYGPISARAEEVRLIYEAESAESGLALLKKYNVQYMVVGGLEREKYPNMNEAAVDLMGQIVWSNGQTKILKVNL